jgi:serine/threonine-protein kinase
MGPIGFGRYRVDGELGRGGMGVVYRAHDPELDREVAIKHIQLPVDASRDVRDELEKRFRREAKAAARIRHPGVVAIHDVGTTDSGLYLVMELVDGESLARRLERGAFPDRPAAIEVAARAAEALAAAHRAGVVHRDVKPANILISHDGRVMLTDFGVARSLDEVSELTRTGMVVGSPAYMAPEQLRGGAVDGRADLFSLGVVLYEMVLRKRPFPSQSITTLLYQILHEDPLADPAISKELYTPMAALLRRLLAKQPEDRYPDAQSLAAALRQLPLESVRADEAETRPGMTVPPLPPLPPTIAATVPPPYPPHPPAPPTPYAAPGAPRRTALWLLLGTVGAALVVVAGVLATWNRNPERPIVQPPRPAGWNPNEAPLPDSLLVPATPTQAPLSMIPPLPAAPTPEPGAAPTIAGARPAATETEPSATSPPAVATAPPSQPAAAPAPPEPAPQPTREEASVHVRCRRGVEFDLDPSDALVTLDGRPLGPADEVEQYEITTPGHHTLRLTAPGYKTVVVDVEVAPDARSKWEELEIEMEELPSSDGGG